ncbi:MAG: ABC transporter permease [Jatrophihabitantaceae bacterium]
MTVPSIVTAEISSSADTPADTWSVPRARWLIGLRSPKIVLGLGIVAFFICVAIFGPMIDRTDPSALSAALLQPPSASHWLGTTQTGQDILAQLITSARVSLFVGFVAGAIATVLSLFIGVLGGYLGGIADELLSVVSNIFLVIPALPLVIVLAAYIPGRGALSVTIVISVTGWAWGARVLRAQTLSIRRRDYVQAARVAGEGTLRIIVREIMPNELAIIAANFLFTVIFAILTEAGLAFLGLANVSNWSWGTMLYWAENDSALQLGAWWWFAPPGLCIALVGTGLALINFGIDEFVNPRLRTAGIGTAEAARRRNRRRGWRLGRPALANGAATRSARRDRARR